MLILTAVLLVLTIVLCGAYAGMILMCQIGVLPAMRLLRPAADADAWRAMDVYLDRLMPPYKGALLLINAALTVSLALEHRFTLSIATGLSLLLSIAGLVLTVRGQLPLNTKIKQLPAGTPDDVLSDIRERTVRGFTVRFVLAQAAFLVICCGAIVWPLR